MQIVRCMFTFEFVLNLLVGAMGLSVAALPDLIKLVENEGQYLAHPGFTRVGDGPVLLAVELFLLLSEGEAPAALEEENGWTDMLLSLVCKVSWER